MEILILITVAILLIVGVIGSVIPVLPGPPISYSAILLLHFFTPYQFDTGLLITLSIFVVVITFLDYWFQFYGVKKKWRRQESYKRYSNWFACWDIFFSAFHN